MTNREALEVIRQHLRGTFHVIDDNSTLPFTENPIGELLALVLIEDTEKMDEEFHPRWPRNPEDEQN